MASAELDEAVASEDWGELLAAVEADDDPAAAVRHVEPAIAGWPDERRELPTELWRELSDGAEPLPWLPLTRHLRLESGDGLAFLAHTPWLTSLDLTDYQGPLDLVHVPGLPLAVARSVRAVALRRLSLRDVSPRAALPRLQQIGVTQTSPPAGLDAFDARRVRVYDPERL